MTILMRQFLCWWRGRHDWVYETTEEAEADTSGWTPGARRCSYCERYQDLQWRVAP